MYLLMLVLVGSFIELTPGKSIGKRSSVDHLYDYLMKYGYLSQSNIGTGEVFSTAEISNAVKNLQKMLGLDVNGDLEDPDLKILIKQPRCGVTNRRLPNDPNKPHQFAINIYKWKKERVTWNVQVFSEDMDEEIQREIFRNAFNQWSQHLDISFLEVNARTNADIVITFVTGEHGENCTMDGPGQELAHAFPPSYGIGGDVHFDDDEAWGTNETRLLDRNDKDLFIVALHEFGHSLGLNHSSLNDSVMYPIYHPKHHNLHQDDIEGIQALYGIVVNPPNPCKTRFDDVILSQDEIIVFKNRWFWRFDKYGKLKNDSNKAENISQFWQDLPLNQIIDAATELPKLDLTIFFIGRRFWLMRGKNRVESFPVEGKDVEQLGIPSIQVNKIDAAMVWGPSQRVYIFSNNIYWRLSNDTRHMNRNGNNLSVDENYPKSIVTWMGRIHLDAAFTNPQGESFVFWEIFYWKYNQTEEKWGLKFEDRIEITELFDCESNYSFIGINSSGVSVMKTCKQLLALLSVVLLAVVLTLCE